ncbi:bifunctional (p)ppGpp synthetase/guanosine-3',5'-bis(diphosphate) 3'-pyrophosphohydrolase [Patescibacteria group bacterium]|nr:MAG: bifunctional (p)ppGpp synthetase/guanosine-3',5'-bis(diphosphate) 3'-pyrophosphohydrolase [Patescibacteria group bacterium]
MPEIVHTFEELAALVRRTYRAPDLDLLRRAYELAAEAHKGEKRETGHPFITHPLAVAYKLVEMGMHVNVVTAGLLHDVIEDTGIELDEVREKFGPDVAALVDSVTKLKKIKYQGVERYVENMRKMFLAMASDVRVVFIKFADRLHNLQTLYAQPEHKQLRTSREVMDIYAPIAGRLGMGEMKGDLEDLAFAYLQPKDYERVRRIMETRVREKGAYVDRMIARTHAVLAGAGLSEAQVHGRVKRIYSLFRKLTKYGNDLSKVYDVIAVRIMVGDVEKCYAALGVLHQAWKPLPGRVKDYIAQPKPNNYQSLHTTVFGDEGEIVEFQIRTQEMHEMAEFGIAAHWRYKEAGMRPTENLRWMEELAAIQKEIAGKEGFLERLEAMKIDVFKDRIFVFTPKGDVIDLPDGATAVDFAFAIHSEIGNKMTSVKVNERLANLDTVLYSGDIIEVVTDRNRKGPNPDWLKYAKTRHAREKIKDATKHNVKGWLAGMLHGREKKGEEAR